MQAVIMAGGEGSRLRPLTSNMPKPMLPVANRPMMEHILLLLRKHGYTDVVATVQFLSSVIRNYFDDGSELGVSLSYANEEVPLGTAGSVLGARDFLSGTFLVISGDALTDLDLGAVADFHRQRGAAATLVLKSMPDPLEFGIVMTDQEGRIERFLEKPTWGQVFSDTINTGIYVVEQEVLDLIPPDQPYDFSSELFPLMLDKGLPLYGYVTDAYWTDVGNTDAYLQANQDVLAGRVRVEMEGFEVRPGVWVGEDVEIDPSARVEGPALIGDNVRIGAGAHIRSGAVIGQNTIVDDDAVVGPGVVMERAHVGAYARVHGGVMGRNASLDRGATLEEGAVLGDEVRVGAGALIQARVKVYPARTVEAGAIVTQSVVSERRATRSLFGSRGVSGLVNVGLTPIEAVRLGMAYGTTLRRGSVVVTGRDASRAARTIKRAVIAGLNATGVTVHDLELTPMPVTRFTVNVEQATGGVSVRTSPRDLERVEIRLFDGDGADLPPAAQRKIERVFFRDDYRRTGPSNLGELEFPPRALEQYAAGLMSALEVETIRSAGLKVVVDYAFGSLSLIGPGALGKLGCDVLSVNAFADEHRPVLVASDVQRLLEDLADHVRKSGSHLGVLMEPGGEIAHLVDDKGRVIPPETALLAFVRHQFERGNKAVAVPVSAPAAVEALAAVHEGTVHRTPVGLPALMARVARSDIGFAGDPLGHLMFGDFMAAPDALMAFGKALELVATTRRPLSETIASLPRPHIAQREVRTPWDRKGAVMRHVAEVVASSRSEGFELVLIDGVKAHAGDRWALVVPYPDEPLCAIWAEGRDPDEAEALADRYAALVEEVVAAPSS